jgi:hypothetical protein
VRSHRRPGLDALTAVQIRICRERKSPRNLSAEFGSVIACASCSPAPSLRSRWLGCSLQLRVKTGLYMVTEKAKPCLTDCMPWTLSAFDLEFVDYNNDVWEISIPASTWEEQ